MVGTINGNKSYLSYGEMQSLLADMMDRINNRPIGLKSLTKHDLVPLTPNCLLLGRTSTVVSTPADIDYGKEDYPKRLKYCEELLQFWRREFDAQVFYNLLPYQRFKDTKRHRNLQVGDVCLLEYSGKIGEHVRYCRIDEVHPDEDGVVRNVTVSLRSRDAREKLMIYRSRKPLKMLVGVKRLVLICPNEEIDSCERDDSNETPGDDERRPGCRRLNDGEALYVDKLVCSEMDSEDSTLRRPGSRRSNDGVARSLSRSRSDNTSSDTPLRTPGCTRKKVEVSVNQDAECILDLH